jgi:non-ribosomal peptide synthetase component F
VSSYSADGFTLDVSYRREAISAAEVEVILDHYEMALNFMAREPHARVRDVDFITADEKRRLLHGPNPLHPLNTLLSSAQNVSELIESQVQRTPQRIAVSGCGKFDGYGTKVAVFIAPI